MHSPYHCSYCCCAGNTAKHYSKSQWWPRYYCEHRQWWAVPFNNSISCTYCYTRSTAFTLVLWHWLYTSWRPSTIPMRYFTAASKPRSPSLAATYVAHTLVWHGLRSSVTGHGGYQAAETRHGCTFDTVGGRQPDNVRKTIQNLLGCSPKIWRWPHPGCLSGQRR